MDEFFGQILVIGIVASVFVIFRILAHQEKMRKIENLHKERLAAIDKGLPPPEMPVEPAPVLPPPAKPMPNAPLVTGIIMIGASLGVMAILFLNLPYEAHGFWIIPLPVFLVGFGLMLYHFLKQDQDRAE